MIKYKNDTALKALGKKINAKRISEGLAIEDVAEMTGFAYNTIVNIENGSETNLSYFMAVCFAINVHPKVIFDIELDIKPVFPLSASRKEKSRLTPRIKDLFDQEFFNTSRSARDVATKLMADYELDVDSKTISALLLRFAKSNYLEIVRNGRKNSYLLKGAKKK